MERVSRRNWAESFFSTFARLENSYQKTKQLQLKHSFYNDNQSHAMLYQRDSKRL